MMIMKVYRIFTATLLVCAMTISNLMAQTTVEVENELIIVGEDTVSNIIPEKNYSRFDRGLKNYVFAPKGEYQLGLTASYGEFDADDVQVLSILKDLDFKGHLYSIKPSVSYFFKNNQSIGLRLNYTRGVADLSNLSVDFDDDLNFTLHDVKYHSNCYAGEIFYRRYIGLDKSKRFAIFNETNLSYMHGTTRFQRYYNEELRDTRTTINEVSLNFCPGVCVFIMDAVSLNLSFGVFGVSFRNEDQTTNGVDEGSRFTSGANFKLNIFNLNFGIGVHI